MATVMNEDSAAALEEAVAAVCQQTGTGRDDFQAVCLHGDPELLTHGAGRAGRVQASAVTGNLEGAQPLLDLAAALHSPALAGGGRVLALAVAGAMACAAVIRK